MITRDQYLEYKKLVDEYEHAEYEAEMYEDDDYDDRGDDVEDSQAEEDYERACACTCGAWVIGKSGKGIHVADCFCGAD